VTSKNPLRGEVVGKGQAFQRPSPFDALNALTSIVDTARECYVIHQVESTKRARLSVYEETEVAKIKAAEAVLQRYFEQVFGERRAVYDELFNRLDRAIESDDAATVHGVLRGIVEIAQSSPLADLGDLSQIRKALDDPNQVWDL
jgi:hypothetical protein